MKAAMKKIFKLFMYYTFCVVLFSSCISEKKRREICAECKSVSNDSIVYREKISLKDTFIYVSGKPVIQIINNPCDTNGILKPFHKENYNNGVKSVVNSIGGVLVVECHVDSLKAKINYLERQILNASSKHEIKEIKTNYLTGFQSFCIKWFWINAALILLYIIFKILKTYFKFL